MLRSVSTAILSVSMLVFMLEMDFAVDEIVDVTSLSFLLYSDNLSLNVSSSTVPKRLWDSFPTKLKSPLTLRVLAERGMGN